MVSNSELGYYKVAEISTVTDGELERVLNHWSKDGWQLDAIHFAMRDSSKRPAMAFVIFQKAQKVCDDKT